RASRAPLPSSEPSSTAITSCARRVCARSERRQRGRVARASRTGSSTETRGAALTARGRRGSPRAHVAGQELARLLQHPLARVALHHVEGPAAARTPELAGGAADL